MKKSFFILTLLTILSLPAIAQESSGSISLGKIKVYLFQIESLKLKDGSTGPCAVGYEHEAELFTVRVGDETFYKIKIGNESYSVMPKPFSGVSSQNYKVAVLDPGPPPASYLPVPTLTHIAGQYLLNLPYSTKVNTPSQTPSTSSTPNTSPSQNREVVLDWQLLGKVTVYNGEYRRSISHGEEDVTFESETAFLYSAFDGKEMKYKISIPKYGSQYDVHKNSSYNGDKVHWDRRGKRITYLPSVSSMYTHYAGGYYFNVDSAK